MKFAILMLCLTIVHSSFLSNDIAKMKYYRSLIDHLHRENYAKGVLIISNVDYNCFDEMTYWHETSRKMSNRGIATDIVNFKVLKQNLPFYTNQIRHILFVIIIQNMDEVNLFAEINFNSNWSESPWVILFSGNNNQDVCEFCREPHRNVFNLKFNSDIVVVCCNSTDINEWWSATGDYTQVRKLAQWIDEKRGVEWLPKKSLYERRTSLEGRPLRIGIVKRSTDIWIDQGDFNGYLGKVLKALSQLMNFTISTVISEHSYGTWDPELSEWTGALGRLQRNEVDMVVSSFIMTADRFRVADFTIPTVYENSRLYFKKPGVTTVQWNAYFKAFSTDVWLVIIALILIVPLLLTIIQSTERLCFFPLVLEHYLSVWGIYCQQGLPELPEKTPLRIVYTSAFLSALIITMAYSASLTSFLAVSLSPLPFKTMDEFAKLGTYELIAIIDSADYVWLKEYRGKQVEKLVKKLIKPRELHPQSIPEGFLQICKEKVAFHTTYEYREGYNIPYIPCEIAFVKTRKVQASGVLMPHRSEFTAYVNHCIQRLKYSGLLDRWKKEFIRRTNKLPEIYHPSVPLDGVTPVLGILTAGVLIAIIVLSIERIVHRSRLRHKQINILHAKPLQRIS